MVDVESPTPECSRNSGEVDPDTIDITTEAFAKRLGNLLMDRRTNSKLSVRAMVRRSDGHFSRKQLRQYESASLRVDTVSASALATLYEVDLDTILPLRSEITIDSGGGIISAGGVNTTFEPGDPRSVLETYLRLVRRLRNQERDEVVSLRREDIEGLAAHLDQSGDSVVEQLGALMGATRTQRRLMIGMFMTGAMVITIAVPSVAAFTGGDSTIDTGAAGNAPSVVVYADDVDVDVDVDPDPGVPIDGPDPAMDDDDDDDVSDLDMAGDGDAALPDGDSSLSTSTSTSTSTSPAPLPAPSPSGEAAARSDSPTTPSAVPTSDAAGDDQVGVAPPPVPPDTPPIVEPGNSPVNLGSEPESESGSGSGSGSGGHEPVVEPDVAVGGPPIPSSVGDGSSEIVEPGDGPVVGEEEAVGAANSTTDDDSDKSTTDENSAADETGSDETGSDETGSDDEGSEADETTGSRTQRQARSAPPGGADHRTRHGAVGS